MQTEYNQDTLNDYKTYRRECREKGVTRPMDFEAFEYQWNKEGNQQASGYASLVKSMTDQRRYV